MAILKQQMQRAVEREDYEMAATCKAQFAELSDSHGTETDCDPQSMKLLTRVVALRCLALPTKLAIGGQLISSPDVQMALREFDRGIAIVEDHIEEFEGFQFRAWVNRLEPINTPQELLDTLGASAKATGRSHGVLPDDWIVYAMSGDLDVSAVIYCMANRWAQQPPTKEEAFQLAELFDHLGHPFAASALRNEFFTE